MQGKNLDHLPEGNPDGMRSSSGAHGVDPVETGVDAIGVAAARRLRIGVSALAGGSFGG